MDEVRAELLTGSEAEDALIVIADINLKWFQLYVDGCPVAETCHASYCLYEPVVLPGEPEEVWWLTVRERVPDPAVSVKTTSRERRKLRRAGARVATQPGAERVYSVPCKTEAQAKRLADRHAALQNWGELEVLHQEVPLNWEKDGAMFVAYLQGFIHYSIEPDGDVWHPTFQPGPNPRDEVRFASYREKKQAAEFEDKLRYATLDEAKAACERHRVTGTWE